MTTIIADSHQLIPYNMYAIGFSDEDNVIDWDNSYVYFYMGNETWTNTDGLIVDMMYHPGLHAFVSLNAADAYILQY